MKSLIFAGLLTAILIPYSLLADPPQALKEKLCRDWKYSKCRIMGVEYTPKPSEQQDGCVFFSDMTFRLVEEGQTQLGTWRIIDAQQATIELSFNSGVRKTLRVEVLNKDQLVYTLSVDWQHEVTIYMDASSHSPSMQANGLYQQFGHGLMEKPTFQTLIGQ